MFEELASQDACELAQALRNADITAVDVTCGYLDRIEGLDNLHGAFARVCAERAIARAEALDLLRRNGQIAGPLHGVPIAIKDLIDVEGVPSELGSQSCMGRAPADQSATVVSRLEAAGAIVIGKSNTVEFAFGGWGTNRGVGTPRNPWGALRHGSPGGSSNGSGVAVAAGLVPVALGTDTGGSVRIPSAFCGLTGLRPTLGRVPVHGIHPVALSLDTVGPMARSARDVALLFSVMCGPDLREPETLRAAVPFLSPETAMGARCAPVRGVRIGCPDPDELGALDPGVGEACAAAIDLLAQDGATVSTIGMPVPLVSGVAQSGTVIAAEAMHSSGTLASDGAKGDPAARNRVLGGAEIAAHAYLAALHAMNRDRQHVPGLFGTVDILAFPTLPITAKEIDQLDEGDLSPSRFTRFASWMGLPALSVPVGLDANGLPVGLQLVAAPWQEALLIGIARRLQRISAWHLLRPPEA